jgi:hypothetical protein
MESCAWPIFMSQVGNALIRRGSAPLADSSLAVPVTPSWPADSRSVALIENVQDFDAEYFGLTPLEASLTSPEQRLLIECAEEATQDHDDVRPAIPVDIRS